MSIKLITRPSGTVPALADAILQAASNVNGILKGCAMSASGAAITVAAGWLLVEGRTIEFPTAESVTATAAGLVCVRIDLSGSPYASLVTYPTGTSLTRENLFDGGNVYEQQLGTFSFSGGAVTNFRQTIGDARCNLSIAPQKSRSDIGIYIQATEPASPKSGDIWLW